MIYSIFTDRLGNNLFQFAAALSLDDKVTICVPDHEEYDEVIKFQNIFFKDFKIINYIPKGVKVFEESSYNYKKINHNIDDELVLKGYFQSYKYINREKILKYLKRNTSIISEITKLYPDIVPFNFTAIHVRRGDYLRSLYKHPFCGLDYYKKAIKKIGSEKKFIVISDDIKWCKKNIKTTNIRYIDNSSILIDFFIMTLSNNLIISNSSFSYWGAFLNEKKHKVIAPSLWFGFRHKVDISDLLPPEYEIINNNYTIKSYTIAFFQFIIDHIKYKFINVI